jgi:probable F420-dependent oxidoreductase
LGVSEIRWGIDFSLDGLRLRDHADLIRRAEELGYTDLWTVETWGHDGFTPLAYAAGATRQMRLGTGVVGVMTRGPALLAQQAGALADASDGRFVLGIGCSSEGIVSGWNAMSYGPPLRTMAASLDFLRAALAGERTDTGFKLERAPEVPPKIILAAMRGKMLHLAARKADGAFANFLPLAGLPQVMSHLDTAPDDFEVACHFYCFPGVREDVELAARRLFAGYVTVPGYEAFFRWLGYGEAIDPMVAAWKAGDRKGALAAAPWELIEDTFMLGTPEEIRERVVRFVRGGVTLPVLTPVAMPATVPEFVELMAPARLNGAASGNGDRLARALA